MSSFTLSGDPPVEIALRRSGRARRYSLRISRLDGQVTLTLPRFASEAEALDFARQKGPWIRKNLAARPEGVVVEPGADVPVEGILRRIEAGTGRRITLRDAFLMVPEQSLGPRLRAWLKELARDRLSAATDAYAAALGKPYGRITLRDTRSRWGSCTSAGNLNYSWRLILAPPDVLNYVAAHEVCHLAEMNHSRAYWDHVARLYPAYQTQRSWLRDNGEALHAYRFD